MKRSLVAWMTVLAPLSALAIADAADARKPFPVLRKLVKAGALEQADLDAVKALRKAFRECRKSVKAGTQPKGSCVAKRIEQVKAQIAAIQKAVDKKIEKKKLRKKAKRALRRLKKRLGKLEARASAAAAKPAATPPAEPAK